MKFIKVKRVKRISQIFCGRTLAVFLLCVFFTPLAASATTIYTNYSIGNDTTGDGTAGAPYKTFHKAYTMASSGDTLNLAGIFNWSNSDETGDVTISGYTLSKNLTITGQNSQDTIIQASSTTAVADRRIFTVVSTSTVTIQNITLRNGRVSGSSNDGGAIKNSGVLTLNTVELYGNRSVSDYGGAVSSRGTTTIMNSAIYNNTTHYGGGGVFQGLASTTLTMTNNTVYGNSVTSSGGAFYGGGVYVSTGFGYLTNNTIVNNTVTNGLGGGLQSYSGSLYMANNIVASNTASYYAGTSDFHTYSSTNVSRGHNIIGRAESYSWATLGDWTDSNGDRTFVQNTTNATGTLNMDSSASLNDNANYIKTFAISSGSISINNGTSTSYDTNAIPSTDQRGASRNSTPDIGAFEFDGTGLSIVAPITQASAIATSSVQYDRLAFGWTNGSGSKRIVFMKQASSGSPSPSDATTYTANSVFGSGSQIGSTGWYAVYDGVGTSTTVTGLVQSTSYQIAVLEYNGVGTNQAIYQTATASNNPITQVTYTPTSLHTNYTTGNDTTGDGSSGLPYKTFHKAYTVANGGDTINLDGTFNWSNSDETGDVTVSGYTIAKDLNIVGTSPVTSIIQATSTDNLAERRLFTVSSGVIFNIQNVTMRYAKVASANGGCILANGSSTITYVEMYGCRAPAGSGGAIYNTGPLSLSGSTIYDNFGFYSGGGVYSSQSSATTTLTMTNNTVYRNSISASGGAFYGAGIYVGTGRSYLTNNTIISNITTGSYGIGAGVYNASTATIYIANNIIASNTAAYYVTSSDWYLTSGGTVVNNGNNIIGRAESYGWSARGDWTDSNGDRTFVQNTTNATGTVSLATSADLHNSLYNTRTFALNAGSIAINNGTTTANSAVSIPLVDQRGASRSGLVDIGAYEYNGSLVDTTAPVISSLATSTTATTTTITWSTNESATSTVDFGTTSNYGTASSSSNATTSHSYVLSDLNESTTYHFRLSVWDASGNLATSSDQTFTTADTPSAVSPTSISVTAATTTAVITWNTSAAASSKVSFGATTSHSSSTPELDTSSRVTSHSVSLFNLPRCAKVHYIVSGENASALRATSSSAVFYTRGCTGSATINSGQAAGIQAVSGGTVQNGKISIVVPVGFTSTSSAAVFQANELDSATFFASAGVPVGKARVGSDAFNLKALYDTTENLDTFEEPLEVTLSYEESDIAGLIESSLEIQRYDDGVWYELSNCTVDTVANEVTCETEHFSDFSLFGDESPLTTSTSTSSSSGGQTARASIDYGCRDSKAINFSAFVSHLDSMCKYGAFSFTSSSSASTSMISVQSTSSYAKSSLFKRDLKLGDMGNDVQDLQKLLNAKGFLIARIGPGSLGNETKTFGRATQAALIRFQVFNKISPSIGYFGVKSRGMMK